MALSSKRMAVKKFNREARRKKLAKLHQREEKAVDRGDFKTAMDLRNRRLKNRRNHHRKMDGEHTRKSRQYEALNQEA